MVAGYTVGAQGAFVDLMDGWEDSSLCRMESTKMVAFWGGDSRSTERNEGIWTGGRRVSSDHFICNGLLLNPDFILFSVPSAIAP